MHINRNKLLKICLDTLHKMACHKVSCYRDTVWAQVVDMDFVSYLTHEIVLLDCTKDCRIKGNKDDWNGLPDSKSLFKSPSGLGLPIGNLTSQLFSNVYLNVLDQYMKRTLKCRHYGRYVDDFYVVSADKDWLHGLIPKVKFFLENTLGLQLHCGKLRIDSVRNGVEFVGAFLKPWRNYISNNTLKRMRRKIHNLAASVAQIKLRYVQLALKLRSSLNSFCGVLGHYSSLRLRHRLLNSDYSSQFTQYGSFNLLMTKFALK